MLGSISLKVCHKNAKLLTPNLQNIRLCSYGGVDDFSNAGNSWFFTIWFFKVFVINQVFEKAPKSGFKRFFDDQYYGICSFIVAACSLLHFLLATASHPTVIDL